MSIDSTEAYGFEKYGVSLKDEDGNVILYITGGNGSPVGTPSPLNTKYYQIENSQMWKKYGANDEDWIIDNGTFEQLTFTGDYKVPADTISKLYGPCMEAILDVEGILEIL